MNELYDLFSEFDARRNAFFSKNSLSDSIGLTNKYERTNEANHVSDGFTLRTAEAYLNLAEALVMQGKEAEANSVLHQLQRQRIDDKLDDRTGEELVNEIRNERRRELCFEGHRWFDLRRYSVLEKHPLHKTVVHAFNAYTEQNSFLTTHLFTLPSGDAAYTFSLPESFVSFDKVPMPNNLRPERVEVKKPRELLYVLPLALTLCAAPAQARKKKNETPPAKVEKKAPIAKGFFGVQREKDDVFFVIPDSLLRRPMLVTTRFISTPAGAQVYGGELAGSKMLTWERHNNQLLLRAEMFE